MTEEVQGQLPTPKYAGLLPYLAAMVLGGAAGTGGGALIGSPGPTMADVEDKFATQERVEALEKRLQDYKDQTKDDLVDLKTGQRRIADTVEGIRDHLIQRPLSTP